jgi:hypothetical protein
MKKHLLIATILLWACTHSLFAQKGQEVLSDIEVMPITNPNGLLVEKTTPRTLLSLPFYDDFSYGKTYPMPSLWNLSNVLINTKYARNEPNIGVVTFDAINSNGQLHTSSTSTATFPADTLTSRGINLLYPSDTTIYISFMFQPQGLGNEPQVQDSLILDFFDPLLQQWVKVWSASANFSLKSITEKNSLLNTTKTTTSQSLNDRFFRVHFPILNSSYLVEGFQFRFRNLASIAANQHVPSLRGNSDHWHIDLVYINRNRNYRDTLFNDVAFFKPLKSILKNYESIPWKHFNAQSIQTELPSPLGFTVNYRNQGPITWNLIRQFSILNNTNNALYEFTGAAENIFGFEDIEYTRNYTYNFASNWPNGDSASYTLTSYLITDNNPETNHLRWNDTLSYTQRFANFYAYDDGSAENGYGLYGEGTQNGRVAVKFTNYKADSLVGVYMYFNRILTTPDNPMPRFFKFAIWADNNGKPGQLLYEELGFKPTYTNSLNRFTLFKIDEPVWLETGTFYVGWIQTTTEFLNVGFDLNRIHNNKIFFNIDGTWTNSQFEGSLMIRPVFGSLTENPTAIPDNTTTQVTSLYPNPTQYSFSISMPNAVQTCSVKIFNISGQMVTSEIYSGGPLDVSQLPNGIYLIKISQSSGHQSTHKLIISR